MHGRRDRAESDVQALRDGGSEADGWIVTTPHNNGRLPKLASCSEVVALGSMDEMLAPRTPFLEHGCS